MSRSTLSLSLAVTAGLLAAGCGGGDDPAGTRAGTTQPAQEGTEDRGGGPILEQGDDEIRGSFSVVAMAHTTPYAGAELEEQQPTPWDGGAGGEGPYRYAAIPCNEDAPVNNISGDLPTFNALVPGSRVPASTRSHPLEFTVTEGDDGAMQLEGTLELTVCQLRPGVTPDPDPVPDPEKDRIRVEWTAQAVEAAEETVVWQGSLEIVGGTGPYEELRGEGTIAGYFFCFAPEGCAELGEFRDVQFTMSGSYTVPAEAVEEGGS
ncbi:hypothetical protein [Blastococcus mobilis]|uniref:Lipoprotein n=1 Tax=Blastococcus mobilis TaxID=1938746 RepID=A0A238ZFC4_9ACTN|nr:hypothetical protein [Blastococcus mobilis]SNR81839.1 hypothetical protein SAMN06272737_12822 [Blastococcus mobilis]